MLGQGEILKLFQNRFPIVFYFILAGFGVLELRMIQLQIFRGSMYRRFSESNSVRKERLPGPRGQMFDRFGRLLVDNRLQLDVVVTPQFVRDPDETMTRLAILNNETPQRLIDLYNRESRKAPRFQPITIIPNAPWDLVVKIESSKDGLSGVDVETRIRRTYLLGSIGAQVFGYVNEVGKNDIELMAQRNLFYESGDYIGRFGLEKQWERFLRGKDGERYVVVDAHGHRASPNEAIDPAVANMVREDLPPEAGSSLVLTLDSDLQLAAAEAMTGMMGAVVALDPRSGEVLAMISQPSFDPTDLSSQDRAIHDGLNRNPFGPLRNKAIQDHFSPGSTFKIFTALAALENGIINTNSYLSCPPILNFAGRPYHEHNRAGFGTIDLREAIKKSSNVYVWQLALRLNINQIAEVARSFGLGSRLGIDLPNEVPGLIPDEEWKQRNFREPWFSGETLSAAIGQGYILSSPLQMAAAFGAVGNKGLLYMPYLVSKVVDREGRVVKSFEPKLISKRKMDDSYLAAIRDGLSKVVNEVGGTGYYYVRHPDVKIAGKSGTTQVITKDRRELFMKCEELPYERRHHAWFVGFAPYENPEIVVAAFGMNQCAGSRVAGPIVRAVIDRWYKKKKARERTHGPEPATAAQL